MTDTSVDETSPLIFHPPRISNIPDERTLFQRKLSVWLILSSAGFERLAFYSLAGNLTFFLDSKLIKWTFPHTIIGPLIFLGNKIQ